jgi:glycosyltransferase involved in cell wall biosynthesis
MDLPLISIIIPSFNRAPVIGETLDSVMAQTYENWECIIVDDGSTDNTSEMVAEYVNKDNRFQYYNRPSERPKGANACRNYGFELSKGEFVNWFDSDDLMHADFLLKKLNVLNDDNVLDFCSCVNSTFCKKPCDVVEIQKPTIMQSENYIEDYLIHGLYFFTPSPLWRRTFLSNKELFDESLHRSQERDFHFRMLIENPAYTYINEVLFFVRIDGDSISNSASTSIKAQLSVFMYFDKVFNSIVSHKNIRNQKKLLDYVFYRQSVNFYNLNILGKSFFNRVAIFLKLGSKLLYYNWYCQMTNVKFFKIVIGFPLLIISKKGFAFFYFPEYNYRSYDK